MSAPAVRRPIAPAPRNGAPPNGAIRPAGELQIQQVSADAVPPRERFSFWKEAVCDTVANVDISRGGDEPFWGAIRWRGLELGASERVEFIDIESVAQTAARGRTQVAREGDARLLICIQVGGTARLAQSAREDRVAPGDMFAMDCTQPGELTFDAPFNQLVFRLARDRLAPRLPRGGLLLGQTLQGASPLCGLVAQHVRAVSKVIERTEAAVRPALIERMIDLIALAFAGEQRQFAGCGSTVRRALVMRAMQLIETHLHDPALTVERIAGALGVSSRYLHHMFQDAAMTVAGQIRRRRLERCRDDLADPLHDRDQVTEIALRWGFRDMPHFSRAFRQQFGLAPRDYRTIVAERRHRLG